MLFVLEQAFVASRTEYPAELSFVFIHLIRIIELLKVLCCACANSKN